MPVSLVCESQTDLSSAIRSSLSTGLNNGTHNGLNSMSSDSNSIQNQLVASAKRALLSKIEYEEVNNYNNSVQDTIKSKYIVLKPPTSTSSTPSATVTSSASSNNVKSMVNGSGMDKSNNSTGNCSFVFFFSYDLYFIFIFCSYRVSQSSCINVYVYIVVHCRTLLFCHSSYIYILCVHIYCIYIYYCSSFLFIFFYPPYFKSFQKIINLNK